MHVAELPAAELPAAELPQQDERGEDGEMGRKFVFSDSGVKVFVDFKDNLMVDPNDPVIAGQARNWRS